MKDIRAPFKCVNLNKGMEDEKNNNNNKQVNYDMIVNHLFYPLINKSSNIFDEAIAYDTSGADLIYLFRLYGYGLPSWKFSPLYCADNEVVLLPLLIWLE